MDTPHCAPKLVFDILQSDYTEWKPILLGLAFVALGLLLTLAPRLMQKLLPGGLQGKARIAFGWILLAFALAWTYGAYDNTYPSYKRLREAAARGQAVTIEGPIEHFHPMPYGGHDSESFDVAGEHFSFSDYSYTGGFNRSASHGGPLHEGLWVRIAHIDHIIVKLETASPPPCS